MGRKWKRYHTCCLYFLSFTKHMYSYSNTCLTSSETRNPKHLKGKAKTGLHGLSMWFLLLCRIIEAFNYSFALTCMSSRDLSLVRYDRRIFKSCFQHRLVFYETPVFHHDLLKFLYRRVVGSDKRQHVLGILIRADCLESKVTSDRELSIYSVGYPRAPSRPPKFARHSSNVVFEEFVPSSLIVSPLIKPLFTPGGWHQVKWVH